MLGLPFTLPRAQGEIAWDSVVQIHLSLVEPSQAASTNGADVFQICIHGRGGQGVVTASELLAQAAFLAGNYVQVIPSFGSERTGAPVVSFCRLSDGPIVTREPVHSPDAVIVQDPTLLGALDVFAGLAPSGWALVNTRREPEEVRSAHPGAPAPGHLATVPADDIVREHLGQPKPSAALLGAFAALTGQVALDDVLSAIKGRFHGRVADGNCRAAQVAFDWVARHAPEREEAVSRA